MNTYDVYRQRPTGPRTDPWSTRSVEVLERGTEHVWCVLASGPITGREGDRVIFEHRSKQPGRVSALILTP